MIGTHWSGTLPGDEGLAASEANLTIFEQPIRVYGAVCLDSLWNNKDKMCEIVPGCSLCRYFLSSPCKLVIEKNDLYFS